MNPIRHNVQSWTSRLLVVAAILGLLLAACGAEPEVSDDAGDAETDEATDDGDGEVAADEEECAELDPVTFRLNWVQNYNQLSMTVAFDKGWYEEECIDLDLQGGQGSGDTVQVVGTGAAEIGIADAVAVIQGQEQDLPVTAVGVLWRNNSFTVLIRDDALDTDDPTPEDLYGLRFGAVTTGSPYIFWQAFVNQQDIDMSQIEEVSLSPPGFAEMAQGSVDFLAQFRGAQFLLAAQGVEVTALEAADFGQEGYGLAMIANSEWLEDNGDVVTRFLRASARGMIWSAENPEESVEILGKYQSDPAGELEPFIDSVGLWTDEGADAPEEFFRFDDDGVLATQQLLYDAGVLEGEPGDILDQWTTEYLPEPDTYTDR